jgi:hypothetical protein
MEDQKHPASGAPNVYYHLRVPGPYVCSVNTPLPAQPRRSLRVLEEGAGPSVGQMLTGEVEHATPESCGRGGKVWVWLMCDNYGRSVVAVGVNASLLPPPVPGCGITSGCPDAHSLGSSNAGRGEETIGLLNCVAGPVSGELHGQASEDLTRFRKRSMERRGVGCAIAALRAPVVRVVVRPHR